MSLLIGYPFCNFRSDISTALLGLVGYPTLGITKPLTARKGMQRTILGAKGEQVDVCALQGAGDLDIAQIAARFESLFS